MVDKWKMYQDHILTIRKGRNMKHVYNEENARRLLNLLTQRLNSLGILIKDEILSADCQLERKTTLSKMLEDGKFPATESKDLQNAFDCLYDALEDLKMSMLIRFDMEDMGPGT